MMYKFVKYGYSQKLSAWFEFSLVAVIETEEEVKKVGMRIFVSSTCYDLTLLRAQIRDFIATMGYEPIMSDYEDVLYDTRIHTHTSCVNEVSNCDMLIFIIGSRFGGKGNIEALNSIDFDKLQNEEKSLEALKKEGVFSVTQLEVLKAIESQMPVYSFIDKRVWHDHEVYEKNKHKDIINNISFPSIEKQELATYIFNFINFVRGRTRGNNIFTFEKASDIENTLKKQWANYFQKLLYEQRYIASDNKKMDIISDKFEDLKTAILTSIDDDDRRDIARGIVSYRRMFEIVYPLSSQDIKYLETTNDDWDAFLKHCEICEIRNINESLNPERIARQLYCFVKKDKTFFRARFYHPDISRDWNKFVAIPPNSRKIIIEALEKMHRPILGNRFVNADIDKYFAEKEDDIL